jgi:hypothetical protein
MVEHERGQMRERRARWRSCLEQRLKRVVAKSLAREVEEDKGSTPWQHFRPSPQLASDIPLGIGQSRELACNVRERGQESLEVRATRPLDAT